MNPLVPDRILQAATIYPLPDCAIKSFQFNEPSHITIGEEPGEGLGRPSPSFNFSSSLRNSTFPSPGRIIFKVYTFT